MKTKRLRKLWLKIASSFTLNFISLGVMLVCILFNVGDTWVWKCVSLIFCINALFLNANYYPFIRHRLN